MRIKTSLEHSDTVSGTWIMDDGTKCYWTEGRSTGIICVKPNGEVLDIPVYAMGDHRDDAPELIDLLIKSSEEGPNPVETREMTEAEEAEHAAARS